MNLLALQKYIPTAEAFMNVLGDPQKKWLHENVEHAPIFIKSVAGQQALQTFLTAFYDHTTDVKKLQSAYKA